MIRFYLPLALLLVTGQSFALPLTLKQDDNGLLLEINGPDAKKLYDYLLQRKAYGAFVVTDSGMGKSHISSPSLHCVKLNKDVLPAAKQTPGNLYHCRMRVKPDGQSEAQP